MCSQTQICKVWTMERTAPHPNQINGMGSGGYMSRTFCMPSSAPGFVNKEQAPDYKFSLFISFSFLFSEKLSLAGI